MLAAIVLVPCIALNQLNDVFTIPKMTVLAFAALALLGVVLWRATVDGILVVPRSPAAVLVAAIALVMVIATVLGDHLGRSFFGEYGRSAGLLTYLAGFIVFLAVLTFDVRSLRRIAEALAIAVAAVAAVGLLQVLGFEPFPVAPDVPKVVSTLGQANFVAAFVAMGLPFVVWIAADRARAVQLRVGAGVLILVLAIVAVSTKSFQVFPALAVSGAFVVGVHLTRTFGSRRILPAAGAVVGLAIIAGFVLRHRLEEELRAGFDERILFWQAAGRMIKGAPFLGGGFSAFASEFASQRPTEHAVRFGAFQIADAPHDVPIGMFVTGGAVLGLLYLAFVVYVGVRLVQGLRRAEGADAALLGTFGAAWAAYQVQSLVSIDVPPLIVVHLVVAAAILVLAERRENRFVRLGANARSGRRGGGPIAPALVGIAVLALIGLLVVLRPARADIAFASGRDQRADAAASAAGVEQGLGGALRQLERATDLGSWNGVYWAELAAARLSVGDQDGGLEAGKRAADAAPSTVSYALSYAQLAQRVGRTEEAEEYFRRAVRNGGKVPIVLTAHAEFLVAEQRFDEAVEVLERARRLAPDDISVLMTLGRAHLGAGDEREATALFERVLEISPGYPPAMDALGLERKA